MKNPNNPRPKLEIGHIHKYTRKTGNVNYRIRIEANKWKACDEFGNLLNKATSQFNRHKKKIPKPIVMPKEIFKPISLPKTTKEMKIKSTNGMLSMKIDRKSTIFFPPDQLHEKKKKYGC